MEKPLKIIAHIENDFTTKFGIPRQSGLASFESTVVFEPEFRNDDALRGLEGYSHLWLIWKFSEAERDTWSPTVRPPRLGGNKRVGVFATRSPFRPNPIGLSSVELIGIKKTSKGSVLKISGADLMNGTPIYDIKPYLSFTDSHPDAACGFADEKKSYSLTVDIDDLLLSKIPQEKRGALLNLLSGDPRPQYIDDSDRIYGFSFSNFEIKFKVSNGTLYVTEISEVTNEVN